MVEHEVRHHHFFDTLFFRHTINGDLLSSETLYCSHCFGWCCFHMSCSDLCWLWFSLCIAVTFNIFVMPNISTPVTHQFTSQVMKEIQDPANAGAFVVLPSQFNGVEFPSHCCSVQGVRFNWGCQEAVNYNISLIVHIYTVLSYTSYIRYIYIYIYIYICICINICI